MGNTRRVTSYGVYAYRRRSETRKPVASWDLHASVGDKETAYMQGRLLLVQPDVEKVDILQQICNPDDGLCKSRVVKTFKHRNPVWQRLILLFGGLSSLSALTLFLFGG